MDDYFLFGLIYIKKSNQIGFFIKKIETERVWFDSVISEQKLVFLVWLGFSVFFFRFGFNSVFPFQVYKTEPVSFLKIPINFFSYLFSSFFYLISFSKFFSSLLQFTRSDVFQTQ
jgi:Na+/H+ antiporter NhaC